MPPMKSTRLRLPENLALSLKSLAEAQNTSCTQLLCEIVRQHVEAEPLALSPEPYTSGSTGFRFVLPSTLDAKLEALSARRSMTKSAYLRYLIYQDAKNQKI